MKPLRGHAAALASSARHADPLRPGDLGSASLFVANGAVPAPTTTVQFNVAGAATSNTVQFLTSGGATWSLSSSSALSITGTFPVTDIFATRSALSMGLPAGALLQFGLSVPIERQGSEVPTVEVTNLSGTTTVTWPTTSGLQTQVLPSGDPLSLIGLIS